MADRYWVGGSGTWSTSTANWSATSGGGSGASAPTSADNVFFDQAGTYTVTLTGSLACLDWTVSAGTVTFATGTSPIMLVNGSVAWTAGTTTFSGAIFTFTFTGSGTKTITTNGTTIPGNPTNFSIGTYNLGSALTTFANISGSGTLNTNNYALTVGGIFNSGTMNWGSSTVTSGGLNVFSSSLTLNAGTSQLNCTSSTAVLAVAGITSLTFYNVAFTSTAVGVKAINNVNTFNNLSVTAPSSAGVSTLNFSAQQNINGALSTTGTAGNRRVLFASATYGISVDLVVNSAPSLTDADFRGLYVRGTSAPISGTRIGNRGECRGITFSTPKTVYWNFPVGGNWTNDAWAASIGGTVNTDNFPLPQDTGAIVNTGLNIGGTISPGSNTVPYISTIDMSARTNAMTFSFGSATTAYGNWITGSGVSYANNQILTFSGGTTQTITSAGKTFSCPITIDTYGGTVQLADALNIGSNSLIVTNGTFTTAGYSVSATILSSSNSNVRTINLGSSTVTLSSGVSCATVTNLSFNSGTSQINIGANAPTFSSGGLTFYNVTFTSTNTSGATFSNANIFNNLTFTAPASAGIAPHIFSANQTINGTLTCAGASAVRRIFLRSNTIGTPRTLTVNAISATDCDFRDINLAGAASGASPTRAGDCGGNTGITFPAAKTVYWNLTGSQQWSAIGWASGSGGTPDINNFPLAQDTAVFDNAGAAGSVTVDATWNTGTFDMSGRSSAMTISTVGSVPYYGNILLGTGVTYASFGVTFAGASNQTITSNGKALSGATQITKPASATVFIADDFVVGSGATLTFSSGTFDAGIYNVTLFAFTNNSSANTLRMGSGTWTISGTEGTVWNLGTAPILFAGTSNIVLSNTSTSARTFAGGGLYYNKLTIGGATGTSTLTITGSNTFGELASTKTVAHTIDFGGNFQTFGKWSVTGTAGNVVTITGTSTSNLIAGPAVTGVDYLAMGTWGFSTTSPGEFYAGANSTGTAAAPVFRTAAPAPRTLYWVGGTGNWSSTTKWSTSSGGGSGAAIPTSLDAVIFDAMSNATAYTATIDAGVTLARCASFTMAGPLVGNVTFAGSVGIAFHGNVSFAATGITRTYSGAMNWAGNSSYTFTTNGLAFSSLISVNGIGATWSLGSAFNNSSQQINFVYGTFSTSSASSYALTTGTIFSDYLNSRTVNLNASTITLSVGAPSITLTIPNLSFNAGTSNIVMNNSSPGITSGGVVFYNVSCTGTNVSNYAITGANTFNTLSFTGRTTVGIANVTFNNNQTISTLTLNAGTASAYRTFLSSNTIGTPRTLTVGTLTAGAADIDFRDITIAGAAAPISGTRFGDAKGNSGITFPAAKTVYWALATSNNWGNTGAGSWSATSGGAAANTQFPLAQDTAFIPFAVPNNNATITFNAAYNVGTLDMNERNGSAGLNFSQTAHVVIYGNWVTGTGVSYSNVYTMQFSGRGSQTLTSAGKTISHQVVINSPSGSVTLADAMTLNWNSGTVFIVTQGTFDAASYNVTLSGATSAVTASGTGVRTVAVGSGAWTIAGSGNGWNAATSTNLAVTGTGTISLTAATAKTFLGGGISYSGITLNQGGAGALTITGNNTLKTITNTYSATGATSIDLGATTQTLTQPWTATGEAGRVLTISGLSAASPGTLIFSGAGTAADVNYLAINNVRAYDIFDEWYAGPNSTNGGSLGWYFVAKPSGNIYFVTVEEAGTGTDSIVGGFLYIGTVDELANSADALAAAASFRGVVSESGSGSDTISALSALGGSILESATITDTDLARLIARATLAETATITDANVGRISFPTTITETATGTDAETARYIARPVVNETATGTDTEAAKLTVRPSINEAAAGTDSDSAILTTRPSISETATGSDTDSAKLTAQSVIAELATITDAASARATLLAAVIEAATITDLPSSIKGLFAYILESVTATDSINAPGSTYNPSLSESATATDNIVALTVFVAQIVEATTAADVVAAFKSYFSTVLETASGADLVAAQFTAQSIIAESATGTDVEVARSIIRPSIIETATGSDSDVGRIVFPGNIAESATAADTESAKYTTRPNVAETATGTDAPSARATFRSSIIESSAVQDIVQAYLTTVGVITELATGADQVSALRALAAAISETASTTDTVAAKAIFQGILQELATAQDAVNAPGSTYSAPVVELATLLDAVLAKATFPVSLNETATGTETVQATFIPYAQIIETATITDAASALAIFAARTVESAYITDQVSPPGSIYNPVVLAVAQLLDQVSPPGSIYNAPVLESATISDSLIGGFLWIDVNDDQVANWGDINNVQTTTWLAVDDSQTTNWQNVNNTQTSGWTDVDDTQTPGWNPVLP